MLVHLFTLSAAPPACVVSNGTLHLARFSSVGGGKLLPGFLFMQGESDGLEQALGVRTGGGRGEPIPFVPDDNVDDAIFEGTSPDLRSPQLPYLKYDTHFAAVPELQTTATYKQTSLHVRGGNV